MFKPRNAHQGIHKRSLASVYHLFEIENKSPLPQCPDELNESGAPQFFTEIDGKDVFISSRCGLSKGVGLVRSQSFPPQGWYKTTSKYILKISKTSLNSEDSERGNEDEEDACQRTRTSVAMDTSFECASPMTVEAIEHQPDDASLVPEKMLDTSLVSESVVNPLLAGLNMVISTPNVGDAPALTTAGEDNNLHGGRSLLVFNMADSDSVIHPKLSPLAEASASGNWQRVPASAFPPSGKLLVCGRRREMEDTVAIVPYFLSVPRGKNVGDETQPEKKMVLEWHFFGVFDGHGGSQASTYCMERLHQIVAEEFIKVSRYVVPKGGIGDEYNTLWVEVMKAAFSKIDEEVGGVCPNAAGQDDDDNALDGGCLCCEDAIALENVGTTAIVAVVGAYQIVVANCGDSRAVLAQGGQAISLSRDHKPELENETRRIEAAGGRVICWDGYRVGGLLALSRAIGDRYLKRYVISEPEITCIQRSEDDECLILASDGLWDVVSNEFACEVARKSLPALRKKYKSRSSPPGEDAASAAVTALLVKLAYGRGSKDNISVVVVDLKSGERSLQR